ncbi:hypothetical protein KKC97_08500 [bacterium]|nr:hypothetical protein [bacterium]MBU1637687.1 hypothetical protein [bacterium]MBU1921266.1 hypothetical protein [bacterium]
MITRLLNSTRKLPVLLIGLSLVAFLGIGCSLDSTGVGPNSEVETATYNNSTQLDIELPAGLELVSFSEMAIPQGYGSLDGGGNGGGNGNGNGHSGDTGPVDLCGSGWVTVEEGGEATYLYSGCEMEPGEMPYDAEVTVCLPHPGYAIVDFGPHPLYFNGPVDIWFDISNINCPPQQFDRLEMWYVNDNDALEPVPLEIDLDNMRAVGQTTHFSRYILTKSSGSN